MTSHPQRCDNDCIHHTILVDGIDRCKGEPILGGEWGAYRRRGCASHANTTDRDKVLDEGNILDSFCRIGLYWYIKGDEESDDVGKCRGKDCNYCGRYSEELRTAAKEQE